MTVGTCNKCCECNELIFDGRVCAICSDSLDSQWGGVGARDWVLITTPGPSDKAHSALLALKKSLGLDRGDGDGLANAVPVRYIYRNATYAEMKSHWALADPPGEHRLDPTIASLRSAGGPKSNVTKSAVLRPATREEIAEHDLKLVCRRRDEEVVKILEKWGLNDEYGPIDGVWDDNIEVRIKRANEEIRQRLTELGLPGGF